MKISKKAFSLIELSIVVLILGILIAGITQSSSLVRKFKLNSARALTQNSPASGIRGMVYWFEPTLESSFISSEAVDQSIISRWNDNNPQGTKFNAYAGQKTDNTQYTYNVAPGGTSSNTKGPTYIESGLNSLPTLRFANDNTNAYRYLVVDKNMKNSPVDGITQIVVFTYRSGNDFFIDRSTINSSGAASLSTSSVSRGYPLFQPNITSGVLRLYYRDDTCTPNSSPFFSTGYALASGLSYILTIQRKYGSSFNVYINGTSSFGGTSSISDPIGNITLDPTKIGRHNQYDNGNTDIDISELILYSGNFTTEDRQAVESYLGKKYGIKITHP